MSVLKNIMSRLLGRAQAAPSAEAPSATTEAPSTSAPLPEGQMAGSTPAASGPAAAPAPGAPATSASAPAAELGLPSMTEVDLVAVMEERAAGAGQKLNWRSSIVDLMKLLDLDSSLSARKALATELGYSGDMGDSATMNIWLHKQVMRKIAENGGQVPADLRD